MCGIIGYIGSQKASKLIINSLERLEYRGYDSVGIATLCNKKIFLKKDVGKLDEVSQKYNFLSLPGNIGIGHTRWATHGKVSKKNAHPHISKNGKIAVVHNGIIENYLSIRKELEKNGVTFISETDTEVVPQLIEFLIENGVPFERAVIKTVEKLKGSFALLIINKDIEEIVAVRKESPLVIGIADHGFFIASDIPAFLNHTNKVVYLEDGDVVFLKKDSLKIYNFINKRFEDRKIHTVKYKIKDVEKGDFNHYMIKEILEQAEIVKKFKKTDKKALLKAIDLIRGGDRLFFVAAGTSYHACLVAKYMFSKLSLEIPYVIVASEFENFTSGLTNRDILFAVSQSGETADVLRSVKLARKAGVKIISLVNVIGSSLTRISDLTIPMNAGIEIGVAATKTYTAELLNLAFIAYNLSNLESLFRKKLNHLWNDVFNQTSEIYIRKIEKLAEKIKNAQHIFLIGRGLEYATALEAALKIKEISYIHAEAFPGGELKHGTIALIEKGVPVVVFTSDENRELILSNAEEMKSRGAYLIGVDSKREGIYDFWIKTPEYGLLNPVIQIIPMQLLAYKLAVLKGLDPDKPRNLAKSVTVI